MLDTVEILRISKAIKLPLIPYLYLSKDYKPSRSFQAHSDISHYDKAVMTYFTMPRASS